MQSSAVGKAVYSNLRQKNANHAQLLFKSDGLLINEENVVDGLALLEKIHDKVITAVFFDPQYRGIMEKLKYGNEGERQKERAGLEQMDEEKIRQFIGEIDRVLIPHGHLFLWIDKFHLCTGTGNWTDGTELSIVDLITWDKGKIGMGYRTRRKSEYLLILQKKPQKAKGFWTKHDIPDVWSEKIVDKLHPHQKPRLLQKSLIEAVSAEGDIILDPCAGSYSVLNACRETGRTFIGGDLKASEH